MPETENIENQVNLQQSYTLGSDKAPYIETKENPFPYAYKDSLRAFDMPITGAKSIFNEYAVFTYSPSHGNNNKLRDGGGEGVTSSISRNPSAANIIRFFQESKGHLTDSAPYSFADFAYCKYYGHIPNNYLVTLRRFPFPMLDNLMSYNNAPMPPLAQALTYLGEEPGNKLSEILAATFKLNWHEIEADVQNVEGNERSFEDGTGSLLEQGGKGGRALSKGLKATIAFNNPKEYSGQAKAETDYQKNAYGADGPYANRVYGPVNVVHKTMARARGLEYENDIKLKFHFSSRSIGGINPKMAMLDLISNFLALTYNNAKFWGGAIRYFPQHPNLPFFGDQNKFYNGDVGGYIDSLTKGLGGMANSFISQLTNFLSNPLETLKKLGTGLGKMAIGKVASQSRPEILSFRSLLTGAPMGEWHLVIGNPMNPIAMIGNLVCTNVEMRFNEILGPDDFPTEVEFEVTLKHGKPRDKGDIESIFNLGNGRLYHGINGEVVSSSMYNSVVDTRGTEGSLEKQPPSNLKSKSSDAQTNYEIKGERQTGDVSIWNPRYTNSPFSLNRASQWSDPGRQ
jgi:hypothetical protein